MANDAKTIWQNQPRDTTTVLLEKVIRSKVGSLQARTRGELFRHIVIQALMMAFSAIGIARSASLFQRIAFVVALLWAAVGLFALPRGLRASRLPGDAALTTSLEYYRGEMVRRGALFQRLIGWLFGPLFLLLGAWIVPFVAWSASQGKLAKVIPFLTLLVVWIGAVVVQRIRAQRQLRREIEELNEIERERY